MYLYHAGSDPVGAQKYKMKVQEAKYSLEDKEDEGKRGFPSVKASSIHTQCEASEWPKKSRSSDSDRPLQEINRCPGGHQARMGFVQSNCFAST